MCGVWSEHWQADLSLLQPLKQCWLHSEAELHLTHSTRTQHLWSTLARPVPIETHFGKPLYGPGHCTVTQFQAVITSYSLDHICGEQHYNSQIPRKFFAMRCHVSVWDNFTSKHQFFNCSRTRYTICMVLSSRQNMNMMNRTWLCMVERCIAVITSCWQLFWQ